MKPSEIIAVYMDVPESAGSNRGNGSTIIEVFTSKTEADILANTIRNEVRNHWNWNDIELSNEDLRLLNSTVDVITLEEAIDKIKNNIHYW